MKGKIFISYRRASDAWALGQLRAKLMEEFGDDNVFFDTHSIEGGADWLARLDHEIASAQVVVALYCKEWFGPRPDGSRRIDDAGDMVRRELELAHQHHRIIIPVIIDDSPAPGPKDLPPALHFLLRRQFLPMKPDELLPTRMHRLVQAIEHANPGRVFGARYFQQVSWLALVVTALVAAWHVLGGNTSYDNAFARNALHLRQALGVRDMAVPAPLPEPGRAAAGPAAVVGEELPELAVVDIDDAEFRTLLGGQRPLDARLMSIVLWSLRHASVNAKACGPHHPVAINLDLAPDHVQAEISGDGAALHESLVQLAQCRPVVISCPANVVRQVLPDDDMRWMDQLLRDAPDGILFTHSQPDPEGLRHTQARTDIGIVAADIARGARVADYRGDRDHACACPSSPQALAQCGSPALRQVGWDRSAMAVPFSKSAYSLSGALLNMPRVAARPVVLVGGSFGAQPLYALPGSATGAQRERVAVTGTLMQGYLLHGATRHLPVPGQPWMLLLAFGLAWVLNAVVLALGVTLQRNDDRFSHRVPAYLGLASVMLGAPLATLVVAALWPAWTWLAGELAVLSVLTVGRALLASFEVVLAGGIAWRGLRDLWQDVRFDLDKASAVMKLAGAALEALLLCLCVGVVLGAG